MEFSKRDISRAIEECNEGLENILNADLDNYASRLKQFFSKVDKNLVLHYIIKPYLDLKLDELRAGFNLQCKDNKVVLPEDDDEEIALILQTLYEMKDNNMSVNIFSYQLYFKRQAYENIILFNKNIVEPAFNKLKRKLRYKIEDIESMEETTIESSKTTIISIGTITATNATIGIGENINQTQSNNVFENLRNEIEKKVNKADDKALLLKLITEMENSKNDKNTFKEKYCNFIARLGNYVTIISPFLPQLTALL